MADNAIEPRGCPTPGACSCPQELVSALAWVRDHYANPNINHVDFRVEAYRRALVALPFASRGEMQ